MMHTTIGVNESSVRMARCKQHVEAEVSHCNCVAIQHLHFILKRGQWPAWQPILSTHCFGILVYRKLFRVKVYWRFWVCLFCSSQALYG